MEVLKTLYYGKIKKNNFFQIGLFLSTFCFLMASALAYSLKLYQPKSTFAFEFIFTVLLAVFLFFCSVIFTPYHLICSLLLIKRFQKLFGFMPPTTPEGRNVHQSTVDKTLSLKANYFLGVCAEEDRMRKHLKDLADIPLDPFSPNFDARQIENIEALFRDAKRKIPIERRVFEKYQKTANSQFLPVPFNICPSVKCYKELSPTGRAVCVCKEKKGRKAKIIKTPARQRK